MGSNPKPVVYGVIFLFSQVCQLFEGLSPLPSFGVPYFWKHRDDARVLQLLVLSTHIHFRFKIIKSQLYAFLFILLLKNKIFIASKGAGVVL